MPFVIKTGHIEAQLGEVHQFTERSMYGGKNIQSGDHVYVWCCKAQDGEELAWYGTVESSPVIDGEDVSVSVRLEARAPRNCFGISDIRPFRDVDDGTPISGLAHKLHKQSHRKIAELTSDEATLLDSYFQVAA